MELYAKPKVVVSITSESLQMVLPHLSKLLLVLLNFLLVATAKLLEKARSRPSSKFATQVRPYTNLRLTGQNPAPFRDPSSSESAPNQRDHDRMTGPQKRSMFAPSNLLEKAWGDSPP